MRWIPNRKIVAAAVAGVVTWVVFAVTGVDDPQMVSGVTGLVMAAIGYWVPLPDEQ